MIANVPQSPASDGRRFELKYRLDPFTYQRLRCALRAFARHDAFSLRGQDNRYFVRSLYLDTYDYLAYQEKVTGVANRIKLRIRSYWPDRQSAAFLKIELKTRIGQLVGKFSEKTSLPAYDQFAAKRSWPDTGGPVSEEFRRLVLLRDLRPKLLVDYEREAFIPADGGDVRITFDHALRFARTTEIFPRHAFFHTARPRVVVMEIKAGKDRPRWLERLAQRFQLTSAPNSKYAGGIEHTQHALFG